MTIRERYEGWLIHRQWCAENDGLPLGPDADTWHDSDDSGIELLREAMGLVVELPQWPGGIMVEPSNDHRAARALSLVEAYRKAYYWHLDENGIPTEPLGVCLQDLITDLFHLADRVSAGEDETVPVTGAKALTVSWDNYEEERDMEANEAFAPRTLGAT